MKRKMALLWGFEELHESNTTVIQNFKNFPISFDTEHEENYINSEIVHVCHWVSCSVFYFLLIVFATIVFPSIRSSFVR